MSWSPPEAEPPRPDAVERAGNRTVTKPRSAKGASMTAPIPPGREGLIPHLVCDPCADAIEFYKKAFGAEECYRMPAPDGKRIMHAQIQIGGKVLFLVDDFPEY